VRVPPRVPMLMTGRSDSVVRDAVSTCRYKTPDDKPVNQFGFGERALNKADALKVRGKGSERRRTHSLESLKPAHPLSYSGP
jgi:hypothetical protein